MRVFVTGGTGFIGSHSVAALVAAGHRVRLLVRDEARVSPSLGPLGVDMNAVDLVVGDVTDGAAVRAAAHGCDSALHAASVYSFDSRRKAAMRAVNAAGTELVLSAARAEGLDPIVHVSSFAVFLPTHGGTGISEDSPLGAPREAYMRSKLESEQIARRHQSDGAPVVITYPSSTIGPHDPGMGDQTTRLRNTLRGLMPIWPTGGFPMCDVRDVAALHAAVMASGGGPRRYVADATYVSTRDYVRTLRAVTGRKLPCVYLPARMMLPLGLAVGAVQRAFPWHIPAEYGAIYTCACAARPAARAEPPLAVAARPVADSMADTVAWLHAAGRLSARRAGNAAERSLGSILPHFTEEPAPPRSNST